LQYSVIHKKKSTGISGMWIKVWRF